MTDPTLSASVDGAAAGQPSLGSRLRVAFGLERISAVYVLVVLIVVFSIWSPDTFPTIDTIRQILNNNSVAALAALALVVPLAAGVFDISVPYVMTLSGVVCTWMLQNTDASVGVAFVVAMLCALAVGAMNIVGVVLLRIDSLIATLATGFVVQAIVKWRTANQIIAGDGLEGPFRKIAGKQLLTLTLPVFYMLGVATLIWYLLEHTATGRRIYATGFNRDATRLAGVRTERIRAGVLIVSSLVAGFGGVVLASQQGRGFSTAGDPYLLGAFAAVFLGATQLKSGRFNAWGTILGVLLLGTGVTGLGLAGQPNWVQDLFRAGILLASLALTGFQVRRAGTFSVRSILRRGPSTTGTQPDDSAAASH